MSSELDRQRLAFRLTVAVVITALSLAVVGLTAANIAQGPRLLGTEINPRAAVERAGQILILQMDQSLTAGEQDQVSVAPAVPVEVSWRGATVEVRFLGALNYATDYHISASVISAATGAGSTVTHSFRTPSPELYVLQRIGSAHKETPDHIVRVVPGTADRTVIYSAARIQDFAVSGPSLAVITQEPKTGGALIVGPVSGSGPWKTLSTGAVISQLHASQSNGAFGFVSETLNETAQLHLYDPASGDQPTGVVGPDGKPLVPQSWAYVPKTRAIVAQTADQSFFLIDSVTGSIKPLGAHSGMDGFVNGTQTLILENDAKYATFDLAAGKGRDINLGDIAQSSVIYQLLALPHDRYIGVVAQSDGRDLRFSIVGIAGGRSRTIYTPEQIDGLMPTLCLSPNSQLLAVQAVPPDSDIDQYDVPGYRKSRVVVIDSSTGEFQDQEDGFDPNWCG